MSNIDKSKISDEFLSHAKKHYLDEDQVDAFLAACCRSLRKSIRINTIKIDIDSMKSRLQQYGFTLKPIPWCKEGFWVNETEFEIETTEFNSQNNKETSLGNLVEHLQGLFYIQEASSMLPPVALLPSTAINNSPMILDLAAAPGSKTTQLAALSQCHGLIFANELSASRVKVLHANLVRCGIPNVCMSQFDGRKLAERLEGQFDYVLLDAPCGGEGTIRKDEQALQDWQLSKVESIAKLQKELILTAYRCLKPGGRLVYSTCTLSPEENQYVAAHLTQETDAIIENLAGLFDGVEHSLTAEGFLHVLPHIYDSEGFFVASFSKPINAKISAYSGNEKTPFLIIDKKTSAQVIQYFQKHFGFEIKNFDYIMKVRGKEIWLFPNDFDTVASKVRLNRSGIKLAEIYPNKVRSTHEFVMAHGKKCSKQQVEISLKQAEDFYKGRNLELSDVEQNDGEVILMYQNFPVGLATLRNSKLKNQLPRDLVKDQIQFIID